MVAASMIDRVVHHAELVSMRGDSFRLKDRDLGRVSTNDAATRWPREGGQFSGGVVMGFRPALR